MYEEIIEVLVLLADGYNALTAELVSFQERQEHSRRVAEIYDKISHMQSEITPPPKLPGEENSR